MRSLIIGVSLLALAAPAVHAQQPSGPTTPAITGQTAPGTYLVFFDLNRATLTGDARRVIAEAAEEYRRAGAARIALAGHGDRSGSASANLRMSQRRVEAVQGELIRLGVPASAIATVAEGESDPLLPTADGVRESRNRRVEITIPGPTVAPVPVPAPVTAPAPVEAAPLPEREEEPRRFTFALGPFYGHNFGETDGENGDKTENDLIGAELTFNALPGFLGGVSLKQGILWSLNGVDDGLTGRSVLSLDLAPDLGLFRPFLSANFGGVYGEGVQDGLVAGPEIGFNLDIIEGLALRAKVAYDYQFRNSTDWDDGWDEGILWGGLDFGLRF